MSISFKNIGYNIKRIKQRLAYDSAARKQIKKKAQAAYYQAKEKEAIKAAQRKAKAEYSPRKKQKSGIDNFFKDFDPLRGFK